MPRLPALAYGFAATFSIRDLAPLFAGASLRQTKKQIVAEYGPGSVAVGFEFGALVFVNVGAEERARVIGAVLTKVAVDEPHAPLEEDFVIETREGAPQHGVVEFDRVTIPELTAGAVDVITLLLAQSVCIDYYEEDVREILRQLDRHVDRIKTTGRLPESSKTMARFVGAAIDTKNQVVESLSVLDKPLVTWENEALDKLFRDLRTLLEIEDRFRALEYRLRTVQETLELFIDLGQTRRMLILETTVVVLILIEVVLGLVKFW